MRNTLKKFIGDKKFYAMVLAVALPIMLQNGITNFVSLLDNIMVGQVGTEQMSGVAIVNQLFFVFNLCIFGAVSGAGIFTAQFFGKNDEEGIRQTLRFKYLAGVVLTAVAVLVLVLLQTPLINLYLHDGSVEGDLELTLKYGKDYLAVMLIGLLPYAVSQVIGSTMRETGHTVMPMLAGLAAVVVNCTGNYILIFGHFGAPVMGVVGAAIATVASRFVEMLLLIIYTAARKTVFPAFRGVFTRLFSVERELLKNIFKKGMPLFVNEMLWAIGMSGLAMCYSKRGLAVVTGYNIASTVINVFNIAYMALGNAVGIIIGKYLGAGEYEEAVDIDRKLIAFSVFVGTVMGIILLCTAGLFPRIYNTTAEAKTVARQMLMVTACLFPFQSFMHTCYFTLRSGGKTFITFIYDSVFVCCVSFPLAFVLAEFTTLSILPIYIICNSVEIIKAIIGFVMLKKRIWINKIV